MPDTSRDENLLNWQLKALWRYAQAEFVRRNAWGPKPFLTTTYRGPKAQQKALDEGASRLAFGESLHNFKPAYAFDVAFLNPEGNLTWEPAWFEAFRDILAPYLLEWGGDWPGLVDMPHFQLPMTAQHARSSKVPQVLSSLLVVQDVLGVDFAFPVPVTHDVVTRMAPQRQRLYVSIKND